MFEPIFNPKGANFFVSLAQQYQHAIIYHRLEIPQFSTPTKPISNKGHTIWHVKKHKILNLPPNQSILDPSFTKVNV